jgi:hypothetical protein
MPTPCPTVAEHTFDVKRLDNKVWLATLRRPRILLKLFAYVTDDKGNLSVALERQRPTRSERARTARPRQGTDRSPSAETEQS